MTANELGTRIDIELDRVLSSSAPGFDDFEKSKIATKAQWYYIFEKLNLKNNKNLEGFEETEVRKQGLSELIKNYSVSSTSSSQIGVLTNGAFYDLPSDFMLTIFEEVITDQVDCLDSSKKITASVFPVSHDEYSKNKDNYYKKPYVKNNRALIWRMQYSREISGFDNETVATQTPKRHELITDDTFNIDSYNLRYLKIPSNIVIDNTTTSNQRHSELDELAQEAIIDISVDLLKEIVDRQDLKNLETINNLQ